MSALQMPAPTPASEPRPTQLRAVPNRSGRQIAQLPFVLIVALLLGGGMTGVLVLSTTIQTQSGELSVLQVREAELRYQEAALVAQAQDLRSSAKLAERAWALGMRPNPQPAFIQLPGGQVVGVPTEVTGDELTGIVPVAPPSPTPSPLPEPETVPEPETMPESAAAEQPAAEPTGDTVAPHSTGETQ